MTEALFLLVGLAIGLWVGERRLNQYLQVGSPTFRKKSAEVYEQPTDESIVAQRISDNSISRLAEHIEEQGHSPSRAHEEAMRLMQKLDATEDAEWPT